MSLAPLRTLIICVSISRVFNINRRGGNAHFPYTLYIYMITKEIRISQVNGKVQHLSDIYPVIETNTILNKTITGIGATYSEIKAPRNSIIIEPTRPVIYGKTRDTKHKDDNL